MSVQDNEANILSNEAQLGSKETKFGSKETKIGSKDKDNILIDEAPLNCLQIHNKKQKFSNLINPINESEELRKSNF